MVPALSLWLPILLSAVAVFIASSIIHRVLTYHRSDFNPLPSQDEVMTVSNGNNFRMGKSLALWFFYCVLVGLFAAYLAGHALEPGAHYLAVFRFVGAAAFGGYALALLQNSIWYKRTWAVTLKFMLDGLIYAVLTAAIFGWLWPG